MGTVLGLVRSGNGATIAGAVATLPDLERRARTDASGRFRFDSVPAGTWTLHVSAEGYRTADLEVRVPTSGSIRIEVTLLPPSAVLESTMVDGISGAPVSDFAVDGPAGSRVSSQAGGRLRIEGLTPGPQRFRFRRIGYTPLDTLLVLQAGDNRVRLAAQPRPLEIAQLEIEARGAGGDADALDRALFDREPTPGLVGVTGQAIRDAPRVGEADVLRVLQAVPGVVAANDLSSHLNVKGGGPDQNVFLLDGARILAPYHVLGLFGAFNADAVSFLEFYRGALPARFGGAVSSVVDVRQNVGASGRAVDGGLTMFGVRAALRGSSADQSWSWLLAGRRSYADLFFDNLFADGAPFAFHDVQGGALWRPRSSQAISLSLFQSADRFSWEALRYFGDNGTGLSSDWRNAAAALSWSWTPDDGIHMNAALSGSRYRGVLEPTGGGPGRSNSDVDLGKGGVQLAVGGKSTNLRMGVEAELTATHLAGDRSSYIEGDVRRHILVPTAYIAAEQVAGAVRVAPGLRVSRVSARRWFVEPRLSARLALSERWSLSGGVSRTNQLLGALWDDRYLLPGAPFFFLRSADAPALRADGVDGTLDGWLQEDWHVSAGAFARRFAGMARWRPSGDRSLTAVAYDHGRAAGIDVFVRKQRGRLTGSASYTLSAVSFEEVETGLAYYPPWDRRHSLDVALTASLGSRVESAAHFAFGSGTPYWPPVGQWYGKSFAVGDGRLEEGPAFPAWADQQSRFPSYLRMDVSVRWRGRIGGADFVPYLSLLNATNHYNVLSYSARVTFRPDPMEIGKLVPDVNLDPTRQIPMLPTIGFDIHW